MFAHGYFSQNFSWDFVPIDLMNVRTKSVVALPVPDIIGVAKKFRAVYGLEGLILVLASKGLV